MHEELPITESTFLDSVYYNSFTGCRMKKELKMTAMIDVKEN